MALRRKSVALSHLSRLVDMEGRGDSWRVKVSHMCELQINISTGTIVIDFGGMDKYTYEERVRNLREAMET